MNQSDPSHQERVAANNKLLRVYAKVLLILTLSWGVILYSSYFRFHFSLPLWTILPFVIGGAFSVYLFISKRKVFVARALSILFTILLVLLVLEVANQIRVGTIYPFGTLFLLFWAYFTYWTYWSVKRAIVIE